MRRVVVTGIGALSPLGHDWPTVFARLKAQENAVEVIESLGQYEGMLTRLGAPVMPFVLDEKAYNRKATRGMGKVALMATRASEIALRQSGLFGDPVLKSGKVQRKKAYHSHILTSKSTKRKRNLRKGTLVGPTDIRRIKAMLPYA